MKEFSGFQHSSYSSKDLEHGRKEATNRTSGSRTGSSETRHYLMLTDIAEKVDPQHKWLNLKSVGQDESVRTLNGKTTIETRYYITSLANNAELLGKSVRSHWGIENNLHWVLDVAFREDDSRIRKDNAPNNFAILRHIALNLLTQEKTAKIGIKTKRLRAGWDNDYLTKVLSI